MDLQPMVGMLRNIYNKLIGSDPSGDLKVDTGLAQPLTDAQLRATDVPVDTGLLQPLTDTQLRATPVPVSISATVPVTLTLTSTLVPASTALTTILTGAKCVRIFVNGNFGTVNGVARTNNAVIEFKAGIGELLPVISYQTGLVTTLTIDVLR